MGNNQSSIENNCIEELTKINENNLDISNIDKLQIKAIKELTNKIKDIEEKKSDRIFYKLPAINLCSYSLI
jgi:hypothetical protein